MLHLRQIAERVFELRVRVTSVREGGCFQTHQDQAVVGQGVGSDVESEHLGGEEHGEVFARALGTAAEEDVEGCSGGAGRAHGVETLIMLEGLGEGVLVDAGLDDAVDGGSGYVPFRILQFFEDLERFGGPGWLLA